MGLIKSNWLEEESRWVYTCPICEDIMLILTDRESRVFGPHVVSSPCICATVLTPANERPDVSTSWEWLKHGERLCFSVPGAATYWVYADGRLTVHDAVSENFIRYAQDVAIAGLFESIYNKRGTRRVRSGVGE